mgnify:CR=1 FL=1|jgi:Parvulin-like peptidyl-prolyl isomerase
MKTKLSVLALAMAAALTAGCVGDKTERVQVPVSDADAVAVVNGEPITEPAFRLLLEQITQGHPELADAENRQALLKEMVDMTLLAQEARKQGLDQNPDVSARLKQIENRILAQSMVEKLIEQGPDEEALKKAYEERYGGDAKEYHASHILVETQEQALEITRQLEGGADFAAIAKERSIDKASGANGGDLSWFSADQMVEPFAEAVKQLEPGKVTKEPVQSQFGWHVIVLHETRPAPKPTLDEVRPMLQNVVLQQQIEQHVEELRKGAKIEQKDSSLLKPAANNNAG